ncbi:MAG: phasin family protein [Gammaproteobacteria bacterium]
MDNKLMENWQEYNKLALAAAKELETINTEVFEKLSGQQMELANTAFEAGTRYMSTLSEAKAYPEFVAEQTKVISEINEKLIEAARTSADIMTEARESYQAWMEKGIKAFTETADFSMPNLMPTAPKKSTRKAA